MRPISVVIVFSILLFMLGCSPQEEIEPTVYHYPTLSTRAVVGPVAPPLPSVVTADIDITSHLPPKKEQPHFQEYTITVNEFGAYPDHIDVRAYDFVRIRFKARPDHVSQGVVVRSPYFTTQRLLANDEDSVDFRVENEDVLFSVYSYHSNRKVAEGRVLVNLN